MIAITTEYWPPISHAAQWYGKAGVLVQTGGTYQKQSFLNRCKIAGVGGVLTLSVPLIGGREQKVLLKNVLIDNAQRWPIQHLRTIRSCYGKAPFFDYYFPGIEEILMTPVRHLAELNQRIFDKLVIWLKWEGRIATTSNFTQPVEMPLFIPLPYTQVFDDRQPFQANLSILDVLFCMGPASKAYLQQVEQQNGY